MRRFLVLHILLVLLIALPLACEAGVLGLNRLATNSQDMFDRLNTLHDLLATSTGYFTHRGREDSFVDLSACKSAFHAFDLDKFDLPEDIVAAFIRNEQHYYIFADDQQDSLARAGGPQWDQAESNHPTTSIGPAQLQIHTIKRLLFSDSPDGSPLYSQLKHLRTSRWSALFEPNNTALLVAAYLNEEATNLQLHDLPVSTETLIYLTNPDVMSFNNRSSGLVSPDLIDRKLLRTIGQTMKPIKMSELQAENWRDVVATSRHVRNVLRQLALLYQQGNESVVQSR